MTVKTSKHFCKALGRFVLIADAFLFLFASLFSKKHSFFFGDFVAACVYVNSLKDLFFHLFDDFDFHRNLFHHFNRDFLDNFNLFDNFDFLHDLNFYRNFFFNNFFLVDHFGLFFFAGFGVGAERVSVKGGRVCKVEFFFRNQLVKDCT